jgi:hypothetical protein
MALSSSQWLRGDCASGTRAGIVTCPPCAAAALTAAWMRSLSVPVNVLGLVVLNNLCL